MAESTLSDSSAGTLDAEGVQRGDGATVACGDTVDGRKWQDIATFRPDGRIGARVRVGGQIVGRDDVRALTSFCSSVKRTVLMSLGASELHCAPLDALVVIEATLAEPSLVESTMASDVESYVFRDARVIGEVPSTEFCSARGRLEHSKPVSALDPATSR